MNKTPLKSRRKATTRLTASSFEALPDSEKERIYQEIDSKTSAQLLAKSKPLTPRQRAKWNRAKKNLGGRPKLGKEGTSIVSVTVEKRLLREVDAYAKLHGMKRSELVSVGLVRMIRTSTGKAPVADRSGRRAAG